MKRIFATILGVLLNKTGRESACIVSEYYVTRLLSPTLNAPTLRRVYLAGLLSLGAVSSFGTVLSLAADAAPTIADTVKLFVKTNCYECHSGTDPEGDIALDQLSTDLSRDADSELWGKVLQQVVLGQMPPEGEDRPAPLAVDQFARALDTAFVAEGLGSPLHSLVTHPKFGNHVNHDLLFSGKIAGPAFSPSRVWRRSSYNATVGAFALPARIGIRDFAAEGHIDEPTLNSLIATISGRLANQFDGVLVTRGRNKGKRGGQVKPYVNVIEADRPAPDEMRAALTHGFQSAMQRNPTAAELDHYLEMLKSNIAKGGNKIGLKMTLTAIYLNPEAIFRMELGLGEPLSDGRRMLSPDELYFAICLALADEPIRVGRNEKDAADHPHAQLQAGRLKSGEDVRRAVEYLLANKEIAKPRIQRFFHEFFSFQETETIFKDGMTSYQQRRYMMRDAEAFIRGILSDDKQVFEQLLTKTEYPLTVARGKMTYTWPMLSHSYSLSKEEQKLIEKVLLKAKTSGPLNSRGKHEFVPGKEGRASAKGGGPRWDFAGERAGMLCHPTWLFAWSTNIENHPVQRGKWVLEHLLAGTIPEVPITVQAQVPEDPHRTLRERYVETREKTYCWSCHKKMNPLGMAFETYDYMGKFRTEEVGKAVDAAASFDGTGIPVLDGKGIHVNNAVELMDVLAKEPRVRQSIIRHAFRYFMGRNEMLSDSPTLIAADRAYVESGGSFNSVIASLLTSDSFLYRK